jgi:hypothetical protein
LSWLFAPKAPEPWMLIDAEKPPEGALASVDSLTAFAKVSKLCLSQINQLVYDILAMTYLVVFNSMHFSKYNPLQNNNQ